jgi:hypothetical protein
MQAGRQKMKSERNGATADEEETKSLVNSETNV